MGERMLDRERLPTRRTTQRFAASFACVLLAFASASTRAAGPTPVSGAIASDTKWQLTDSPYVLSGEVQIANGARLTIEPGVTVLMNAGAALTVANGALSAQGLSDQPIVITSAADAPGSSTNPARGDWGSLKFEDGTIDSASVLSHVEIRYGHGIVIHGASPTIRDTDIDHHAAAAITLDVAASPRGDGLSASDNVLNGIAVPGEVVTGDVVWGLKGIPYVVEDGTLEIGPPPFGIKPAALQIVAGQVGHLTVNIPDLAPAGGTTINLSSNSSVASVPGSVTIAQGAYQADVAVNAASVGSAQITASATAYGSAHSDVTVTSTPTLQFDPAGPVNVGIGHSVTMSVVVPAGSTQQDVNVNLGPPDSHLQFPSSVTIPQNQTSVSFTVQGVAAGTASLQATATGFTSATSPITVHASTMTAPATAFVAANHTIMLPLTFVDAPEGGSLNVTASTNGADAVLHVQSPIVVPEHATHVDVPLQGLADSATPVTLTFSATGYQSVSTSVTVRDIAAQLAFGENVALLSGSSVDTAVVLTKAAPTGGATIWLRGAVTGVLEIAPDHVTIPQGQTQSVPVTFHAVSSGTVGVTLQSTAPLGIDGAAVVSILPPIHMATSNTSAVVGKGLGTFEDLCVDGDVNVAAPIHVNLSVSQQGKISFPSSVDVDPVSHCAEIDIGGLDVTTTDAVISFDAPAGVLPISPLPVEVVLAQLDIAIVGDNTHSVGETPSPSTATWQIPGQEFAPITNPGYVVNLSIVNATPSNIVTFVGSGTQTQSITMDSSTTSVTFTTASPQSTGSYQVKAQVDGVGEWVSEVQQVVSPSMTFDVGDALELGEGLHVMVNGLATAGDTCAIVPAETTVTSADDTKVSIADIAISGCFVSFTVSGDALTDPGQPVVVTVAPPPTFMPPQTLSVTVVPRTITFADLDGARALSSDIDQFEVVWAGTHSPMSYTDAAMRWSIVNESPTDTLPDLPIYSPNGNDDGNFTLFAQNASALGNIKAPTHLGTYQVSVTTPDGTELARSDVQHVISGLVNFAPQEERESFDADHTTGSAYPVGKYVTLPIAVSIVPPNAQDVTVYFASSNSDDVGVPDSAVVPAGDSVTIYATGLQVTEESIAIDAFVGEDGRDQHIVAGSMLTRTVAPQLTLSLDAARAIGGPRSLVTGFLSYQYSCGLNAFCMPWQTPAVGAQGASFDLNIVPETSPSPVDGFQDESGAPAQTMHFSADLTASDSVYANPATSAGTYRVEVGSDPEIWTSDPTVVGDPVLTIDYAAPPTVGFESQVVLYEAVDGIGVSVFADPVTVHVACATPICETDDEVGLDANSSAQFAIRGFAVGDTSVVVTFDDQSSVSIPIHIGEPRICFVSPPSAMTVGQTVEVEVQHCDGATAIAPLGIEIRSSIPDVVTILPPTTVTIPVGSGVSGAATVRAHGIGSTIVSATQDGVQGTASRLDVTGP